VPEALRIGLASERVPTFVSNMLLDASCQLTVRA
jgi:hypothetical protein